MLRKYHKVFEMAQACPINFTSVDNTVSRICSLLTLGVVALFFVTGQLFWLYLLGADLLMRIFGSKHYSLIFLLAQTLRQTMKLPSRKVDGAAKKVAGLFGCALIASMIVLTYAGLTVALHIAGAVFAVCLLLDVAFGFCLGCKVYYLFRIVVKQK
jgi:hypothetical protein